MGLLQAFCGCGRDYLMLFILGGGGVHGEDVNYLPMMSQLARLFICYDGEVFWKDIC